MASSLFTDSWATRSATSKGWMAASGLALQAKMAAATQWDGSKGRGDTLKAKPGP